MRGWPPIGIVVSPNPGINTWKVRRLVAGYLELEE